jgi:HD-GYP domain-containing protein (c-di-GMP phosphodiesterase class II)
MQIIREGVGTQFDPRVVEVFERITTGEIAGIEKEEIDRLAITVV